ncbi:microfibril-associated glycoprotein 4-like [Ylistrum balloti]|uniref:microfibril-associated glycoprotein 4-like n=1 Tax=Ylistrum balloti TaxID=509963 RepID=UPI0029059D10|nr:microfibril-associated glycoprotein 4-like [Ylistrum balloti]
MDSRYLILYLKLFVLPMIVAEFRQASFIVRQDCVNTGFLAGDVSVSLTGLDLMECVLTCMDDPNCLSLAEVATNQICSHSNITLSSNCDPSQSIPGSKILEKISNTLTCLNGGTLQNDSCHCQGGYVGPTCERLATDCAEMGQYSYYTGQEGYFQIQPVLSPNPITVLCSLLANYPKPRLYIQRHVLKSAVFSKTWTEYAEGFSFDDSNLWLGNIYQSYITRSYPDYNLIIELAGAGWNTIKQRAYHGFRVEDETDYFVMTFQSSSPHLYPDAGDSLVYVNGSNFTTMDRDLDQISSLHCGVVRNCGFWFTAGSKCGQSSPNGLLIQNAIEERLFTEDEVFWTYDMGVWSPWYVQMYLERTILS